MFLDLRFGLRMLLKHKGFTAVAVLTLALGIGANTAVFSIIGSVLYPPLPVKEPQRLASIYGTLKGNYTATSYPDYLDYRDRLRSYDGLAAYGRVPLKLRTGEDTEEIGAELVTGNYFSTLGVGAAVGRLLLADDDRTAAPVAVISHRMWRERYGGDTHLIGRSINLNGQDFTVVGVAPEGFRSILLSWGKQPQVWITLAQNRTAFRGPTEWIYKRETRWLMVFGRLKNGVSIEQAEAETKILAGQLDSASPQKEAGRSVVLIPTAEDTFWPAYRAEIVRVLTLLETIAALTLTVACFNIASLLLARAAARRKETSIRLALGAGRWRLVRQWLTESLLLALLGAGAGMLLAAWMMRLPAGFQSPFKIRLAIEPSLDGRALGFTLLIAVLTSVIFGLAPAWQSIRVVIADALKDTAGRGQTAERAGLRSMLVIAQVALALALLTGTGLLVRSLGRMRAIDPGFNADKVLLVGLDLDPRDYDEAKKLAFYHQALERVSALPGITAVSLTNNIPLNMVGILPRPVEAEDAPAQREEDRVPASPDLVSPGYFRTLGIRLSGGREFSDQDSKGAPATIIINQTLARRLWPNGDALGRRIKIANEKEPLTVIGVAPDVKYRSLLDSSKPYFYLPLYQHLDNQEPTLQVRTAEDPMLYASAVRQALRGIDRNVFLGEMSTINGESEATLSQTRLAATFAGLLGSITLLLAMSGLYGLLTYSVAQRTQELGIRMALGARTADVQYLVLGQGLKLALAGVAVGLLITLALARLMASMLYGVSANDPLTLAATAASLICVSALACYLPARRATMINPLEALRHD